MVMARLDGRNQFRTWSGIHAGSYNKARVATWDESHLYDAGAGPGTRSAELPREQYSVQWLRHKKTRAGKQGGGILRVPVMTEYTHNGVSPPEFFLHVAKIRIFTRVGSKPAQRARYFLFSSFCTCLFHLYSLSNPPFSRPRCPLL